MSPNVLTQAYIIKDSTGFIQLFIQKHLLINLIFFFHDMFFSVPLAWIISLFSPVQEYKYLKVRNQVILSSASLIIISTESHSVIFIQFNLKKNENDQTT